MKFYLLIALSILLSSCLKQSIPDAMLHTPGKTAKTTATLRYEVNGRVESVTVADADNQAPNFRRLYCEKSNGYILSAVISNGDFVFTFFTDSLKVGHYNYPTNFGALYVTEFAGQPCYVESPTDNMNFNVTSYHNGHISGNFSGQLTPAISPNIYGASSSVVIKNGLFTNVPVFY